MSGLDSYMKRMCIYTAVYWKTPVADKYGAFSFDDPVEIKCLWKDKITLIRNNEGREVTTMAKVYVLEDLDESGMLFNGTLNDLTTAQKSDPKTIPSAYEIKKFLTTPSIYLKNEFNRAALL